MNDTKKESIGTLAEKSLHAALKYYLEPDDSFHEVKIGRSIADIAKDGEIVEIQTRALYRLAPKLSTFLVENAVTIVYPIITEKTLWDIEAQTGVVSKRKSPKKGRALDALGELYRLRAFLPHPRLCVRVMMLHAEETRTKQGSRMDKLDILPTALTEEYFLREPRDYAALLPVSLPVTFTTAELAKEAKTKLRTAQNAVNLLVHLGVLERMGKKGRYFTYQRKKFMEN